MNRSCGIRKFSAASIFSCVLGWVAMAPPASGSSEESSVVLEKRSIEKAEWLMRQSDNAFTIQLLPVSSQARLRDFVAGESSIPSDRLATFRYQSGDDLLYVLTLGRYDSAETAYEVRESLAFEGLDAGDTWVRPLTDVKRSIRTTLQE